MSDRSLNSRAMKGFGKPEADEARWLIDRALQEDLPAGDITTEALFGAGDAADGAASDGRQDPHAVFRLVSREHGVLCGLPILELLFHRLDPRLALHALRRDGDTIAPGETVAEVAGPVSGILKAERTALNFLQRLSGIATETARWVEALEGVPAVLLDTRKTTPGWRHLEKYAVRTGGGTNHRESLSDGFLLKDNHAWALRASGRPDLGGWVAAMRRRAPDAFLELEVDTRGEFLEARAAGVDAILLDNFSDEDLRWAVERNRAAEGRPPLLEASGGIRREDLARIAATGVDRISVGALTHSFRSLDLSLERGHLAGPSSAPEVTDDQ